MTASVVPRFWPVFALTADDWMAGGICTANGSPTMPLIRIAAQHRSIKPKQETPMSAFQDFNPDNVAHCYGCASSMQGHQIRTIWDGDKTVTALHPCARNTPPFRLRLWRAARHHRLPLHRHRRRGDVPRRKTRDGQANLPSASSPVHCNVDYLKPTPLGFRARDSWQGQGNPQSGVIVKPRSIPKASPPLMAKSSR